MLKHIINRERRARVRGKSWLDMHPNGDLPKEWEKWARKPLLGDFGRHLPYRAKLGVNRAPSSVIVV